MTGFYKLFVTHLIFAKNSGKCSPGHWVNLLVGNFHLVFIIIIHVISPAIKNTLTSKEQHQKQKSMTTKGQEIKHHKLAGKQK